MFVLCFSDLFTHLHKQFWCTSVYMQVYTAGLLQHNTNKQNNLKSVSFPYRIVENFGSRKRWQIWWIDLRFTKVLPAKDFVLWLTTSNYWSVHLISKMDRQPDIWSTFYSMCSLGSLILSANLQHMGLCIITATNLLSNRTYSSYSIMLATDRWF